MYSMVLNKNVLENGSIHCIGQKNGMGISRSKQVEKKMWMNLGNSCNRKK